MFIHIQKDVQRLDGGGSSFIYAVTDEIILKAPVIFRHGPDASFQDQYEFAVTTFYHHSDIQNERRILSLLERAPHPNIIQPVALQYPEGLYLRRYSPFASLLSKELYPSRIWLYRDMLCALTHLHELRIAHADVRIDNFLWDEGGVVLCDLTCSRSFGDENPSSTGSHVVGVNGHYNQVSDVSDRFALASVTFEIESGSKPSLHSDKTDLKAPSIQTGDAQLELIIRKAWFNEFTTTLEMLQAMEDVLPDDKLTPAYRVMDSTAIEKMRLQIEEWRISRQHKFGILQ